jgi:hypothetical protein
MDQVERARRFAQLAYSAALREIVREFDEKRYALRARLEAGNIRRRLAMIDEEAQLDGEQIAATIKAQLKTLLDGYELNGVPIDDEMATGIASEVSRSLESSIARSRVRSPEWGEVMNPFYSWEVSRHVGISPAWIRAEIDWQRFARKLQANAITVYHIDGDTPRVNVHSADSSVKSLIRTNVQLFACLRQKIECCLQEEYEQTVILEKLTALAEAQDFKSFAQRYTDFKSAVANHSLLLTPFIPALAELLHKVLELSEWEASEMKIRPPAA